MRHTPAKPVFITVSCLNKTFLVYALSTKTALTLSFEISVGLQ